MIIPINITPPEFVESCDLKELVHADDFLCVEVVGGIHGLPQCGRLAYEDLLEHLATFWHRPTKLTPGL